LVGRKSLLAFLPYELGNLKSYRIVADFRVSNSKLKQVSHPIPRTYDNLTILNRFTYEMSIDFDMGFYAMKLTSNVKNYVQ
jgi:hypothetical protein